MLILNYEVKCAKILKKTRKRKKEKKIPLIILLAAGFLLLFGGKDQNIEMITKFQLGTFCQREISTKQLPAQTNLPRTSSQTEKSEKTYKISSKRG